ncbi:glycoside hydrolase family 9 protein [Cellulomonas edaphi]|uniref:Endoglucanase n=1 Tax=Cellulomonas edaphi TaxID=3053468 RepID=A0ABT7SCQ0_9CELL|nr:glycoside hydrolase family 9 protein [Cellulomons edaphi]MDM7832729.1 glycoside hydrolase family 9 protein [Cellulomons edaphi]
MVSFLPGRRRATWAGVTTAGLTALALLVAPVATANPIDTVHDFADGPQGWYSYGGDSSSSVEDGEFCVVVPAGTTNPWDVAAQHDGVVFAAGQPLTASFTAHATADVSVPLRAGIGYPDDVSSSVALTSAPTAYSFTWTPGFAGTGNTSFQLGAQASDYTFCLDDFSISGSQELIGETTFAGDTLPAGWSLPASWAVTSAPGDDRFCVAVPASAGQYDGLVYNGLPIEEGGNYALSFTASASNGATVRAVVGENGGAYRTAYVANPELTAELAPYEFGFTSSLTFPADTGDVGQVAIQLGARGDYTFCVTSVSLKKTATPPPPYAPDTRSRVRVNQVGYLPHGPKQATVVTDATDPVAWELRSGAGTVVATGTATPRGTDPTSGLPVQVIDFGDVSTTGEGYTLVADGETSDPFAIDAGIYQQLRYDALNYFYPVRSGIAIDTPDDTYDRPAGHVSGPDGAVNKGDLDVACLTAADDGASWSYDTWTCPAGYARDVVGGWYDAGDHGKYVVNGGIAVQQLMSTYERSLHVRGATKGALKDGTMDVPADESHNGVPDVLDEARWELEFFLAMQVPEGSGMTVSATDHRSLDGLVHHKIHDVGWTGLGLLPSADPQERRLHRPSTAATLNLAATAAQGARLFARYDPAFAHTLLVAAKRAYAAAQRVPDLYAPASAGNNGGGPYDDTDVSDEKYWAAAELYLTTGAPTYKRDVARSPHRDDDIWTEGGFSWGSTAALGRLDLSTLPNAFRSQARASVRAGAEKYLAWQSAQPFGTAYPGSKGGYEWGSNSMVVNNQVVLATAYDQTRDPRFSQAVLESMDYLLGRNALNNSYVTGYGTQFSSHQHSRWLVPPPPGSLAGGPNSLRGTWDPVMLGLFPESNPCTPQMCYVDSIEAWSVNEITVNWNSALSWVASFVADQGAGARAVAPVVTRQPQSVAGKPGHTVRLTAAASGLPAPRVQWQRRAAGTSTWKAVRGATSGTLTVRVTGHEDGAGYRAVFTNTSGSTTSQTATVSVRTGPPVITWQPSDVTARRGTVAVLKVGFHAHPAAAVQWWWRADGGWTKVAGAHGRVLPVRVTDHTAGEYRAVVANTEGSAASRVARVTVRR